MGRTDASGWGGRAMHGTTVVLSFAVAAVATWAVVSEAWIVFGIPGMWLAALACVASAVLVAATRWTPLTIAMFRGATTSACLCGVVLTLLSSGPRIS
jgi:hypothetical protein